MLRSLKFTALTLGMMGAASAMAAGPDLTVVSFGGANKAAQVKAFYAPWEAAGNGKIVAGEYNGEMAKVKAMVDTKSVSWDLVEVESPELSRGCDEDMFEQLDPALFGKTEDYVKGAIQPCGVGFFVWSTVLAYNADKLKTAPTSWADFWDTKKFPGKRGLRKGPKYALEFALMADGVPADQVYDVLSGEGGVDRAFKKLDELKADIIWWDAGAQPLQLLSSGQVVMTSAYNGRISGINRSEGKKFGFVFPGSVYAIDSWVILKDSPNKDAGMDFIAYASKAENQAKLPEYIAYGLPNLGATKLVPEQFQKELPTTEENLNGAVALDVDFWTDNSEELTQRFNAWLAQ